MKLKDKVAFVTGAASGLGHEIALQFAREGARVVIADLNEQAAADAAQRLTVAGHEALGIAVDVANEAQVSAAVDRAAKHFGSLDVLVSNAGIQIVKPLEEFSFEEWKRMLSIHLDGAFLTTRAALRHMYASGRGGSIIYTYVTWTASLSLATAGSR